MNDDEEEEEDERLSTQTDETEGAEDRPLFISPCTWRSKRHSEETNQH